MDSLGYKKYIAKSFSKQITTDTTLRYFLLLIVAFSLFITSCGTTSRINKSGGNSDGATGERIEEGVASWYGPNFHGNLTANGEKYDMNGVTAAHRTLPFNTVVRVHNLDNGKSVEVRINDRGPFAKNRIIDLSKGAAQKIDMIGPGTANVELILVDGNLENSRTTNLKVSTFTVQLGSFREEEMAFDHSREIQGSRVEVFNVNGDTYYRVFYGIYTDKDEANKQMKKLRRQGYDGYVKQIENS